MKRTHIPGCNTGRNNYDEETELHMIRDHAQAHRYAYLGPNTEHENNIVNATNRAMRDTSKKPEYTRQFLISFFNAKLIELADLEKLDAKRYA